MKAVLTLIIFSILLSFCGEDQTKPNVNIPLGPNGNPMAQFSKYGITFYYPVQITIKEDEKTISVKDNLKLRSVKVSDGEEFIVFHLFNSKADAEQMTEVYFKHFNKKLTKNGLEFVEASLKDIAKTFKIQHKQKGTILIDYWKKEGVFRGKSVKKAFYFNVITFNYNGHAYNIISFLKGKESFVLHTLKTFTISN